MNATARKNRYYVTVQKNGAEEIKMIAKAYDQEIARDVAVNHLQLEDPKATYEVVNCFRIS